MTSYEHVIIVEAANAQITREFIGCVKRLDADVAARRLEALISSEDPEFSEKMYLMFARFSSVFGCKTSVD